MFLVLVLGAALAPSPAAPGEAQPPVVWKRVFVLHSYNPEYVWTQNINQGILEALESLPVVYDYAYLDAKRTPSRALLTEAAGKVITRMRDFDPDVVIAADDAAQAYVVVPFLKDKPRPQVVFCGVNAPPSIYGFPASNVSGVRERWHYREGVALLKRLIPSVQSIAFLTDASESSDYIIQDMQEDLKQRGPYALEIKNIDVIGSYQQWQRRVIACQTTVDALALGIYQSLRDESTGKVVSPEEVMAWTNSVNVKPTLGFADYALEHDILCGVLESAHEQGYLAGTMALKTLSDHVPAGTLPMRINDTGIVMLNLKTAERLHIDIPYEIIEAAGAVIQ
nr:ABC transporter substrate binding protein [Fundidesulfovibrio terrae]